jgi:DNA-directed RNA polymerase specialized sigma subunit
MKLTPEQQTAVINNLPLAYSVANRWRGGDREDIEQAAVLGLIKAVATYDPSRGVFGCHAVWHVRMALEAYEGESRLIRVTPSQWRTRHRNKPSTVEAMRRARHLKPLTWRMVDERLYYRDPGTN